MNGAVWDEALIWIHIVHPCEFTLSNHFAVFRLVRCKLFGFVVALEQYFVGSAFLFWEDWRHEIYVWRRKEAGREVAAYRGWAVASTPPQTHNRRYCVHPFKLYLEQRCLGIPREVWEAAASRHTLDTPVSFTSQPRQYPPFPNNTTEEHLLKKRRKT